MAEQNDTLPLRRRLRISRRMLSIAWRTRARAVVGFFIGALLETAGSIIAIYAAAKLGALLASFLTNSQTPGIWLWLWIGIAAAGVTALGFLLMGYAKRLLYFGCVRWSTNAFNGGAVPTRPRRLLRRNHAQPDQ